MVQHRSPSGHDYPRRDQFGSKITGRDLLLAAANYAWARHSQGGLCQLAQRNGPARHVAWRFTSRMTSPSRSLGGAQVVRHFRLRALGAIASAVTVTVLAAACSSSTPSSS